MNTLANSYAVSSSSGDVRGDGLMQRAPRMPQDRFADIPILANANEEMRSDNSADGEGDLSTDPQREQDALTARKRADRSTAETSYAAGVVAASDAPTGSPLQTKSEAGKGDSASARFSRTPCEEHVTAGSPGAEQKKQAVIVSQHGENGQHTHSAGGVARKNGRSLLTPVAGSSTPKGNLQATLRTLDEPSRKVISRKQTLVPVASPKSDARLRGPTLESQSRAGPKRGGASGNLNPAMEALLSRGRETQTGGHKSGASASTGPSPCFAGLPAAAGPHTSVGAAVCGNADVGMSESVSQSVGEQILDSLKASVTHGDGQVLLRLQPPELGMVLVRFREQGEHLDGMLEVDRTDTRREIEQALPAVVRSLQDAGIGIRRLYVADGDPSGQDLGTGQTQQDGSSGYGDMGQDHGRLWTSSASRSPAVADFSADSRRMSDSQGLTEMPRGRINVLL